MPSNPRGRSAMPSRPNRNQRRRPSSSAPRAPRVVQPSALEVALDQALLIPEPEPKSFGQFGLPQSLVTVLARRGIHQPFAIQSRTLPDALAGRDILGRAQTGSGKTLGFGIPMLTRLAADPNSRRVPKAPRGLVLVPT